MINRNPLWRYLLLILIVTGGAIYALPNWFGQDAALQISSSDGSAPAPATQGEVLALLDSLEIDVKAVEATDSHVLVRLEQAADQSRAADELAVALGRDYTVALNLAAATPSWLRALGGQPMYLGLDLRGGVHFFDAGGCGCGHHADHRALW